MTNLVAANPAPPLVALSAPQSAAAEAFRSLRINIQFASLDHPLQLITITSAGIDEGKSLVAANLAITMAQAEQRVILVDCDLRRPALHTLFAVSNDSGVTSMLFANEGDAPPLQATSVPGLQLLASGPLPPRPADILGSRRMGEILQVLRGLADVIIIDTPPVLAVSDAVVLSPRVDGVILVMQAGRTRREPAKQARVVLEKAKAHIVGVVLNDAEMTQSSGYYG
ncbi:MAG: polysaccharide biosynthesis tyrosine autokinase [Chloroflexia bacterium]|nr:polysaccharide biosynthesis tyrosine autokinase [Chloroflexia bacterium]